MKYLLDTNSLSNSTLKKCKGRNDVFILEDILEEYAFLNDEVLKIRNAGIKILALEKRHIDKMIEVLDVHGDNLELIRLYTSEGTGDIAMLAYILSERDSPQTLFPEEYTLITSDVALTDASTAYGIKCLTDLP
ncbi:MAG: hypothetical protein V4478_02840 [Patescibacteria group bacterium]